MTSRGWLLTALAATVTVAVGGPVGAQEGQAVPLTSFDQFVMRGNLMRSFQKFEQGGPARVAFMGGSVTTRQWRDPLMAYLRERFPKAQLDFVMAGIGGTDANLGAFRLPHDVFGKGPVDLFLLEFAVNGGGVRAMEGIVRQARRLSPDLDIVLLYFANTGHVAQQSKGEVPSIVADHEQVAEHYGLPAIFLYQEAAHRIAAGKLTWEQFSTDSVHPTQLGCDIYAECLEGFLDQAWHDPDLAPQTATMPDKLDPGCYDRGHYVSPTEATLVRGFTWSPGWTTTEKTVNFRPPVDVLEATEPGAELHLKFSGTAVGAYLIIGFDAGQVEVSVDGGAPQTVELFDHYCESFHRPQHRMLFDDLPDGPHDLVLKLLPTRHDKATGTAARIEEFMVNGA
jgi:sialidase-1